MPGIFQYEIDRILEIRQLAAYKGLGAYALASKITNHEIPGKQIYRPYLSTVSVIRRYDAKRGHGKRRKAA